MTEPETQCTCITAHNRAVCIGWCKTDAAIAQADARHRERIAARDRAKRRVDDEAQAVLCRQCQAPVEPERHCYATPVCYACLPPPKPLPIRPVRT